MYTEEAIFVPKGYQGETVYYDPDIPIYFANWRQTIAEGLRVALEIDNWAQINIGGISITFSEWKTLDIFDREAIKISANKIFMDREKESNKAKAELEQKLEASKEYKSNFDGLPKPSFFQN